VAIFASGNLDEYELQRLTNLEAPIDGFGVGTRVDTAADAAYLDCAYKIEEYAGRPRAKLSEGKATWPGTKQVYRHYDFEGEMESDTVGLAHEELRGDALLRCVMRKGRRLQASPPLEEIQHHQKEQRESLPAEFRQLEGGEEYPVAMSAMLQELNRQMRAGRPDPKTPAPSAAPPSHHHLGFLGRIYADAAPPDNTGQPDSPRPAA
jgi:nicotinate phosphoribosyltransferase